MSRHVDYKKPITSEPEDLHRTTIEESAQPGHLQYKAHEEFQGEKQHI